MLRSAFAAAALLGLAGPAFASNQFTFETVNPVSERRIIAESVVWTCEGTVCKGELDRKAPTVRICKKFAKEAGEVKDFRNTKTQLSAEEIAACNTAARR